MTEQTWLSGTDVLNLLRGSRDATAAREAFDDAVRLGTVQARYGSATVIRADGVEQVLPSQVLNGKTWVRACAAHPGDEVLKRSTFTLPGQGKNRPIKLASVQYDEAGTQELLSKHGIAPPKVVQKRPRSGGHNMSAHGKVISEVTIELMGKSVKEVADLTEKALADDLGARFNAFAAKREAIGEENRIRMARHIRINVLAALQECEQVAEVVQVAAT